MIAIICPFRDRDSHRVFNSIESFAKQTNKNFILYFVDYGSEENCKNEVKDLLNRYTFVTYFYLETQNRPWNKSLALNFIIKQIQEEYFFVSDIDMIFSPKFIEVLYQLKKPNLAVYFKVGFLSKKESREVKEFYNYEIERYSDEGATGLTLFPTAEVKKIRGYDEFYHFWGMEDTDIHLRFINNGGTVLFYDSEVLLLHQWHKTYRMKEEEDDENLLQISQIYQVNYQHYKIAQQLNKTIVNDQHWGEIPPKVLKNIIHCQYKIASNKREIYQFLYSWLPNLETNKTFQFTFYKDREENKIKQFIKKKLKRRVPQYFSFKEIKEMLLYHLVAYHQKSSYEIHLDSKAKTIILYIKTNISF